ncbi:MAG: SGNH/GDSL hydrolase family protein [Acidobacteriia bacterium]|nr:SGNH/GDSL hydrolase family protein [Terriglobia bacterium]
MRLVLLVFVAAALAAGADLRWMPLPDAAFEVNGLPWYQENQGALIRLPLSLEKVVRPPVWSLSQSPSGGRIRFRSDSTTLAIRLEYPSPPNMANMHAFGQTGVDLYLDGVYCRTAVAGKDATPGKVYEEVLFDLTGRARTERDITLYLPLYKPVKVHGIAVDGGAKIARAKPYALAKPVVFYGTSITQGGCASRPGMSYQAILGRQLNLDFVNLGFSGNGMGEIEMARAVSKIDAAAYVLDYSQNNRTLESLEKVYTPFLEALREKRADAPVIAITAIYAARELLGTDELEKMRAHIRQVVSRRIAAGDTHLQLVEGTDLLGPAQGDGLVDGSHPNDLGFQWMADGLAGRLRKILELR